MKRLKESLIEFIEKGKDSYIEYLKMKVRSLKNESHSKSQDDTHPNPSMTNITYVQPAISVATSPRYQEEEFDLLQY
ncbi:hypothetical protein GLOIN_2v1869814 [Rhizophagus irregularis DAOM 181602=DAOM 197198]|uniref:Uncharacterized protein n=1 Tax=Rhizophagus irregularis (strain DAOM 181602 / DAOM 197198 / MUCL 43194) TaxID=747089 RepID=A0A2H5UCV9_RHIID|nr:hypothetical protein GLOIN_2v1869814 [Rhizophagus irregularis DAOM 181602=DAOM 197198]POG79385.1 hypothetical protein GLOIN_2v1869814 [Rhizophagus irregularis DAOM 181602=DAOM 197198]GBC52697.1 hypothetical protein GLOIN_2v1869814 [Rhizophagus irregularis DAOM 181602=DAOM 197198]|eukprot:XP_025186251.1 hypothetical protein GLOIN_2v1869814 [Rhizophagus irregularis DAOM 181602=DAOM 197198]